MGLGRGGTLPLAAAVALALFTRSASANSAPAPATSGVRIPDPPTGWPDYCKSRNLWKPTDEQRKDPCADITEDKECAHAAAGCQWEATDKKCVAIGCEHEKTEAKCLQNVRCEWKESTTICGLKPKPPACDEKHDTECVMAANLGCVWNYAGAGSCMSCSAYENKTSCAKECHWTDAPVKCVPDFANQIACSTHTEQAPCIAAAHCEWDATATACEQKACGGFTVEATCAAEACLWKDGECGAGTTNCELHDKKMCTTLKETCQYYDADACYAPRCSVMATDKDCTAQAGCEWVEHQGRHRCTSKPTSADCAKQADKTQCDASTPTLGCYWVDLGCHIKEPEFISNCTNKNQTECSEAHCKWESSTAACEAQRCDRHATQAECDLDSECSWNPDAHGSKCSGQAAGHHAAAAHEDHAPPYNILVIFVIGAIGAFFRHNFSDSKLPYTVILFVAGAVFDGIARLADNKDLDNYVQLTVIDPHLLFYIFLPVLIFESAFAVDWFVFKQVIGHCLLLAGPGLCVASFLTALISKYCFWSYSWTWEMSLLFGVTLSATDPVAVVALLKELGASPQISTLIEGESLLNDGTAIVFFKLLHEAVAGCSGHIEEKPHMLILKLIQVACGGPVLGWMIGWIAVDCLNRVFNDPLIEITTTLVTAYVTFFVAEAYLYVSGVLAVVVCGIYMSHRKQCISPEVHHTLHEFWEMAVYLGNTLIFTMAGMIVVGRAITDIKGEDIFFLLLTYVGINIVRYFCIKVFGLIYNREWFGYQLDRGNTILVAWGGLRGAVGLALSLVIAGDTRLQMRDPQDPRTILQSKLVFYVAGIVVLTLLINGVTTSNVVKKYKLDQVSETKKRMMKENFKRLKEGGLDQLEDLKTESALYDVNWLEAKKWVFEDMHDPYNQGEEVYGEGDQHTEAIMHYFKIMHSSVWDQNEEGLLDGDAVRFLLAEINKREKLAKQREDKEPDTVGGLPDALYSNADAVVPGGESVSVRVKARDTGRDIKFELPLTATVADVKSRVYQEDNIPREQQKVWSQAGVAMQDMERVTPFGHSGTVELSLERLNPDQSILLNATILEQFWTYDQGVWGRMERVWNRLGKCLRKDYLEQKWTFGFNVAMALVIAHDAVLAKIDNIADPGEANKLKTHAKQVKREVLQQLVNFASKSHETSIAMKTTLAARTVLNHARRKVWEWQKEGLIEDKEADVLVGLVEKKMKNLKKVSGRMDRCAPEYILSQMEWYMKSTSDVKEALKSRNKAVRFERGQLLIKKGEEHNEIVLITAGSARVHVSRRFDYVGPGYAAGLLSCLTSTTKYCDIYAETELHALVFKAETILPMMMKKGNETFAQALWRAAGVDLAYKVLRGREPYSKWAPRDVRKFVNKGRLLELPKYRPEDKKVSLSHGCYHILISGHARDATNQSKEARVSDLELIEAPCMLPVDAQDVYLQSHEWRMPTEENKENSSLWFGSGDGETREDEVHALIVEDPSSASARARKYWEKIYKKIRSIKTTAALRGADVKSALSEAFLSDGFQPQYSNTAPTHDPSYGYTANPLGPPAGSNLASPLLANQQ